MKRKALSESVSNAKKLRLEKHHVEINDHLATIGLVLSHLKASKDPKDDELQKILEAKQVDLERNLPRLSPVMSPTLMPTTPEISNPPLEMVDVKAHVFNSVWPLIMSLHENDPDHAMFGPCEDGKIKAPLQLPGGKGAATSWHMKITKLALNVEKNMGSKMPKNSCWLVKEDSTHIQARPPGGSLKRIVTFKTSRFLAFLRSPTPDNWEILHGYLNGGTVQYATPFLHFCANGHASSSVHKGRGCVNGIEHGRFGSVAENNAQRSCRDLDRSRCPGHQNPSFSFVGVPTHCIYNHSAELLVGGGWPKPCLNSESSVSELACSHEPPCF